MNKKSYHHGDLKQALIDAAQKILRDEGADALSLRAIAAEVGVSHMAPYSHFKNKKELLQGIAAAGFDELATRMVAAKGKNTDRRTLVLEFGTIYVQYAIQNPEIYRLMLSQVDTGGRRNKSAQTTSTIKDSISPRLETSTQKPFKLLRDAFVTEKDDENTITARALGAWSMVHGMSALIIDGYLEIPKGLGIKELLAMTASPPIA